MASHSYVDDFASVLRDISDDDFASFVKPNKSPPQKHPLEDNDDDDDFVDPSKSTKSNNQLSKGPSTPVIAGLPVRSNPTDDFGSEEIEYSVLYSANQHPSILRQQSENSHHNDSKVNDDDIDQFQQVYPLDENFDAGNQHVEVHKHGTVTKIGLNQVPPSQQHSLTPTTSSAAPKSNNKSPKKTPKKASQRTLHTSHSILNNGITIATHNLTASFDKAASLNRITTVHYPGTITCVHGDASLLSYLHSLAGLISIDSITSGQIYYNAANIETMMDKDLLQDYVGYYDVTSPNPLLVGSVYNSLMCYASKFKLPGLGQLFDQLPQLMKDVYERKFSIEYMLSLFSFSFCPIPRLHSILDEMDFKNQQNVDTMGPPDTTTASKATKRSNVSNKKVKFHDTLEAQLLIKLTQSTHNESLNQEDIYILTIIGFILARYPVIILQPPPVTVSLINFERIMMLLRDFCSFNRSTVIMGVNATVTAKALISMTQTLILHQGLVCYQGPTRDVVNFLDTSGFFVYPGCDVVDFLELLVTQPAICAQGAQAQRDNQLVERAQKMVQFQLQLDVPLTPQQILEEDLTRRNMAELELRSPDRRDSQGKPVKLFRGNTMLNLLTQDGDGNPLSEEEIERLRKTLNERGEDDDLLAEPTKNNYSQFVNVKTTNSGFVVLSDKYEGWDDDNCDETRPNLDGNTDHSSGGNNNNNEDDDGNNKEQQVAPDPDHLAIKINSAYNYNNTQIQSIPLTQQSPFGPNQTLMMNPTTYMGLTIDQEQNFIRGKQLPFFRSTQQQFQLYLETYRKKLPTELIKLLDDGTIVPTSWGYLGKPKYPCVNMTMLHSFYKQSIFFNVIEHDSCIYTGSPIPQKSGSAKKAQLQDCILGFDVFSKKFLRLCIDGMVLHPPPFIRKVAPASSPKPIKVNPITFPLLTPKDNSTAVVATTAKKSRAATSNDKDTQTKTKNGTNNHTSIEMTPIQPLEFDSEDEDQVGDQVAPARVKFGAKGRENTEQMFSTFGQDIPREHLASSPSTTSRQLIDSTPVLGARADQIKKGNQQNDPYGGGVEMGTIYTHYEESEDDPNQPHRPYAKDETQPNETNNPTVSQNDEFEDPISYNALSRYSVYQTAADDGMVDEYSRISRNDSIFFAMEKEDEQIGLDCYDIDRANDVERDKHWDPVSFSHLRYSRMYRNVNINDEDEAEYSDDNTTITNTNTNNNYNNNNPNKTQANSASSVAVTPSNPTDMVKIDIDDSDDEPELVNQNGLDQNDIDDGLMNISKPLHYNNDMADWTNLDEDGNPIDFIIDKNGNVVSRDMGNGKSIGGDDANSALVNARNLQQAEKPSKSDRFLLPSREQSVFQWRLWATTGINMASSDWSITVHFILTLILCGLGFAFFLPITSKSVPNPLIPTPATPLSEQRTQLQLGALWYLVCCMVFLGFFQIPQHFKQHRHLYATKRPVYSAFFSNLLFEQFFSMLSSAIISMVLVPISLSKDEPDGDYTLNIFAIILLLYVLNLFIITSNRLVSSFIPFFTSSTLILIYIFVHLCFMSVGAWWVPYTWLPPWLRWTRYSSPYNWIYYSLIFKEFSNDSQLETNTALNAQIINFPDFVGAGRSGLNTNWYLFGIILTLAAAVLTFIAYLIVIFFAYSRNHNQVELVDNLFLRQQQADGKLLKKLNDEEKLRGSRLITEADLKPLLSHLLLFDRAQEVVAKSKGILQSLLSSHSFEPVMIAYRDASLIQQEFIPTKDVLEELDNLPSIHPTNPRLKNINFYAQPGSVTLLTSPSSLVPTHLPLAVLTDPNVHLIGGDVAIRLQNTSPINALPSTRCHCTLIDGLNPTLSFPPGTTVQGAIDAYANIYLPHVEVSERNLIVEEIINLCDLSSFLHCQCCILPLYSHNYDFYTNPDEFLTAEQFLLVQLALGLMTGSPLFLFQDPFHNISNNPHFIITFMTLLQRLAAYCYTTLPHESYTTGRRPVRGQNDVEQKQFRYTILISQKGQVLSNPALHMCDKVAIWTAMGECVYFGDVGKKAKLLIKHMEKYPGLHSGSNGTSFPSTSNPLTFIFDLLSTGYPQRIDFKNANNLITSHILPTTPNALIASSPKLQDYSVLPSDVLKFRRGSNGFNTIQQDLVNNTDENGSLPQLAFIPSTALISGLQHDITVGGLSTLPTSDNSPVMIMSMAPAIDRTLNGHRGEIQGINDRMVRFFKASIHFERALRHINKIFEYDDIPSKQERLDELDAIKQQQEEQAEAEAKKKKSNGKSNDDSDDEHQPNGDQENKKVLNQDIVPVGYLALEANHVSNSDGSRPVARAPLSKLFWPMVGVLLREKVMGSATSFSTTATTIVSGSTPTLPRLLVLICLFSSVFALPYATYGSRLDNSSTPDQLYPGQFELLPYFSVQFLFPLIISSISILIFLHDTIFTSLDKLHIIATNPIRFPSIRHPKRWEFFARWKRSKRVDFQTRSTPVLLLGCALIDVFIMSPFISICALAPFYAICQFSWQPDLFFTYLLMVYLTSIATYSFLFFFTMVALYFIRNISSTVVKSSLASLLPRAGGAVFMLISFLFGGIFTSLSTMVNTYIGLQYISLAIPFTRAVQVGYSMIIPRQTLADWYTSVAAANGFNPVELYFLDSSLLRDLYLVINLLIILGWTLLWFILSVIVIRSTQHKPNHTYSYSNIKQYY